MSDFRELINDELAMSIAKDAERYRFIKRVMHASLEANPRIAAFGIHPPGKKQWFDDPADFDAAIDEAIAQENK
jgi:hypothetical protein